MQPEEAVDVGAQVAGKITKLSVDCGSVVKDGTVLLLETFDFKARPSVNKPLVLELMRCEYIDKRENVLLVGNSGTGKTHRCHILKTRGDSYRLREAKRRRGGKRDEGSDGAQKGDEEGRD